MKKFVLFLALVISTGAVFATTAESISNPVASKTAVTQKRPAHKKHRKHRKYRKPAHKPAAQSSKINK